MSSGGISAFEASNTNQVLTRLNPCAKFEDVEVSKLFNPSDLEIDGDLKGYRIDYIGKWSADSEDVFMNHYDITGTVDENDCFNENGIKKARIDISYTYDKIESEHGQTTITTKNGKTTFSTDEVVNDPKNKTLRLTKATVYKEDSEGKLHWGTNRRTVKLEKDAEFTYTKNGDLALIVNEQTKELFFQAENGSPDVKFQQNIATGDLHSKESDNTIRFKHLKLAMLSLVHIPATIYTMIRVAIKVVTFSHFWFPQTEEAKLANIHPLSAWARDVARLVTAPLTLVGLMFVPIFGMMFPKSGRSMYSFLEKHQYDQSLLAWCFQPHKQGYERASTHYKILSFANLRKLKEGLNGTIQEVGAKPLKEADYKAKIAKLDAEIEALKQKTGAVVPYQQGPAKESKIFIQSFSNASQKLGEYNLVDISKKARAKATGLKNIDLDKLIEEYRTKKYTQEDLYLEIDDNILQMKISKAKKSFKSKDSSTDSKREIYIDYVGSDDAKTSHVKYTFELFKKKDTKK